ncbi:MAG: GTPase Era [Bacteroidales bacterium]|nr:GTPase Era [Bacteroidales bacterium]
MAHRSGFINIVGNPNVGKSTLMNAFTGEKISIITHKAQTTRHRILGIVNGEDFQAVFSDTPGILRPRYKLQETMMQFVRTALVDADIILYVTDVIETFDKNKEYLLKVQQSKVPVLLIINKIDISGPEKLNELAEKRHELLPEAEIIPVSAKENFNIDHVFHRILELLPEGPAYFPEDEMSDKPERFFVSEAIREKIFLYYKEDVPYCTEVVIESFKEEETIIRIQAVILVSKESQKGILIGKKGLALKKTATQARLDLERFFGKKIFLEIFVKVEKNWRDNERYLRTLGYIE